MSRLCCTLRPHDLRLSRSIICRRQLRRKPGRKPGGIARKTWTGSCATTRRRCAAALPPRPASALLRLPLGPFLCPALPGEPAQALGLIRKKGELALNICCTCKERHTLKHNGLPEITEVWPWLPDYMLGMWAGPWSD